MSDTGRPLVLTMGEPAGIGGEIALKAWLRRASGVPPFLILDDADRLEALAERLGLEVPQHRLDTVDAAITVFDRALPVLHQPLGKPSLPGHVEPSHAADVIGAIEQAVRLVASGAAAAVVTNPIHKKALYDAGFAFPGHTEFLATLAQVDTAVMMLACPALKVVPVTVHVSLRQAIATLSIERIVVAARITDAALRRDFGIAEPRLAVAGLNPHAGEDGAMGEEDQAIVAPAVRLLAAEGILASGPLPADTLFSPSVRDSYDAAICMYHDQALIPLKALDFDGGVNVTLGLPWVRTSPDHGTALAIAGTGKARPDSLIAALRMADEIVRRRAATAP